MEFYLIARDESAHQVERCGPSGSVATVERARLKYTRQNELFNI